MAILGGKSSRENLNLIHGIHDWFNYEVVAGQRVVGEHAVFENRRSGGALAVHIEGAQTVGAAGGLVGHSRHDRHRVGDVALIHVQLVELVALGDGARDRRLGFEQRALGLHFDGIGDGADLHRHIDGQDVSDPEREVLPNHAFKALRFKSNRVRSGLQRLNAVDAVVVGDGCEVEIGLGLHDRDLNIRYGPPTGVIHSSRDGAGIGLGESDEDQAEKQSQHAKLRTQGEDSTTSELHITLPVKHKTARENWGGLFQLPWRLSSWRAVRAVQRS